MDVKQVLDLPISRELLGENLARMAYTGRDGFPRVIPTGFYWDGARLVVCTAERAPKVAALRERPEVALTIDTDTQPPRLLLLRGVAEVEMVDGVPEEFLLAYRKHGDPDTWTAFAEQNRALYDRMARISITPRWAKLVDFETSLPSAVEELVRRKMPGWLPD
jgi:pyridoxamine 5'-phosphate oxidase-like protein